MSESQQLLAEYVKGGSEAAFHQLVTRYIDLVYSAAVRLVNGDTHMAQDVTQTVFVDLARTARTLSQEVMLGGWLHRHTCFVASKTLRGERRRQMRERQALEMYTNDDQSDANLRLLAPVLDDAINELGNEDRKAVLLRYFEQRDFRSVGEALGSNEDAARKRVSRALEKLHVLLSRRGVALSAAALGTALGAGVVSAAPLGMAAGIAATAVASAATAGTTGLTILQIMSMTKVKAGVIGALVVAAAIPFVMQHRAKTQLQDENEALRLQLRRINQLTAENQRLSNQLARSAEARPPDTNSQFRELLKLRGEVGRLRQDAATPAKPTGPSALSGVTANPEMFKAIRDQQKMAMTLVYSDFAKQAKLPKDQAEKLSDLHADYVMENVEHITTLLREGKTREEMNAVFGEQERALLGKVEALLGVEGRAQYQEYTRNLASYLTAEQFKELLTGDKERKEQQTKELFQVMQEERQRALENAGLDPDFQTVPNMNFRNIASEAEAERSIKLLDGIYENVTARASSFLSPEEIQKFGQFRTNAINLNRMAVSVNRKMMAPGLR